MWATATGKHSALRCWGRTRNPIARDLRRRELRTRGAVWRGPSVAWLHALGSHARIDFNNLGPNDEIYLSLVGLIDFAIEQFADGSGPLPSDGTNLISGQALPRFIRDASRPQTYPGQTPVEEDVREYMMRWVRWLGQETDCDGLRLDAIKHVGTSFFGSDFNGDPIDFNGTFQRNYDDRRGFSDANDDDGAQDALLFGEAFTSDTQLLGRYRATGMYALDFPLFFKLSGIFSGSGEGDLGQLSFPQGGMSGAFEEFGGLGREAGISFVQSHDSYAPSPQANAAYAYTLSRVGHSVVFYDGNRYDADSFVIPGREDALGELGSSRILDLVALRRRFARGGMFNRWVGGDAYVFERVVPTSDGAFGATMLVATSSATKILRRRFSTIPNSGAAVSQVPSAKINSWKCSRKPVSTAWKSWHAPTSPGKPSTASNFDR